MTLPLLLPSGRQEAEELLFQVLRALYHFERMEINKFCLTYEQIYLLKFLRRNRAVYVRTIAKEMRVPLFSATRLIDQMERKKLIVRKTDAKDRRNKLIDITAKGERLATRIEQDAHRIIMRNLTKFSEQEMLSVVRLAENFDKLLAASDALRE
jgi:DNA-binding MarR family transcriptional regulator